MASIKIDDLKIRDDNPRKISKEKLRKLSKSIEELPQMMEARPIIVDEEMNVLGGAQRVKALRLLNYTKIPKGWVKIEKSLTEAQKLEFIVKDNTHVGVWDFDVLVGAEWNEFEWTEGVDLKLPETKAPEAKERTLSWGSIKLPMSKNQELQFEDMINQYVGEMTTSIGFINRVCKRIEQYEQAN